MYKSNLMNGIQIFTALFAQWGILIYIFAPYYTLSQVGCLFPKIWCWESGNQLRKRCYFVLCTVGVKLNPHASVLFSSFSKLDISYLHGEMIKLQNLRILDLLYRS